MFVLISAGGELEGALLACHLRRREVVKRKVAQEPILETIEMAVMAVSREEERVSREAIFCTFPFLGTLVLHACVLLILMIYIAAQFLIYLHVLVVE